MVICLERSADLHTDQLMPLPLTVSCFSKIQIGFTFLVPAHPGSPGQRAVKCVCVCTGIVMPSRYMTCNISDNFETLQDSWIYWMKLHCVPIKTSMFYFFEHFSKKSANFCNFWCTHMVNTLAISAIMHI